MGLGASLRIYIAVVLGVCLPVVAHAFEAPSSIRPASTFLFDPKPLAITVRLWGGYDSNYPLVADAPTYWDPAGETESPVAGATFNLSTFHRFNTFNQIGANVRIDGVTYTANGNAGLANASVGSEYDLFVVNPSIFYRTILPMPIANHLTLTYGLRTEIGHNIEAIGLGSRQFDARVDILASKDWSFFADIYTTHDDFSVTFANPDSNRDGEYLSISAGGRYSFNSQHSSMGFSGGRVENNAKGRNWDFDGWFVSGDLRSVLANRLSGHVGLRYEDRDYRGGFIPDVGAPGRTSEQITTVDAGMVYVLDEIFSVDAGVSYQNVDGNMPAFSSSRWKATVGLTAKVK